MFTKQDLTRGFGNAGWLIAGNYASQALSMLTMIVVARKLGPAGYGMFSTATAFVGMFSVFHLTGFDKVFIRQTVSAPEEEDGLYSKILGLKLTSGIVGMVAVFVVLVATNYSATERLLVLLFSVTLLTQSVNALLTSIFQIHERMYWLTAGNLLRQTVYILVAGSGLWWGLFPGDQVVAVMCVLSGTYVMLTVFYALESRRFIPHPLRVSGPSLSREFVRAGLIFSLSSVLVFMYAKVDILIARVFLDTTAVGLYATCMNTVDRITSPISVLLTAFFPATIRRIHENKGADVLYVRRISIGFGTAASLIAVVGTGAAAWLVPMVFGSGYLGAIIPMRVLLWAMVPSIAMMPYVTALQASRHEDVMLKLAPLRAGLNIALDVIVLELGFGIVGIAAGSVIASVVYNAVFLGKATRRLASGLRETAGV